MGRAQNQFSATAAPARGTQPSQQQMLAERFVEVLASQPDWQELHDRLLASGGGLIAYRFEEDLDKLLARGEAFTGPVEFHAGAPIQCHRNVAELWDEDPSYRIATGWALSKDGVWRQHSFGLHNGSVVETTEPRERYFGVELTEDEATDFADWNL